MSSSQVSPQPTETPSARPAPAAARGWAARYWVLLAIFGFVVASDQLTKGMAVARLTNAFELQGAQSLVERVAGLYSFENLDNEPFEEGKADLRRRAVVVVPGFWNHKYVENPGAAWGLLAGVDERIRVPFFHLVSLAAIAFILLFYRRLESDQRLLAVALALVLGGAVGNYIDRIARNYVIDFIDWHWRSQHWPTFNVADAAISVGVVLMLADAFFGHRSELAAAPTAEQTDGAQAGAGPNGSTPSAMAGAEPHSPAGESEST